MFSIAAINDTDSSRNHLEPLAPTKEAQESRLTQMYHEALLNLQTGQFLKAQHLFQGIIEDPLSIHAQKESKAKSSSMVHLRFLTFKNLAETYCKHGTDYYKDALECYIQAVSIDQKDVVLWNRLGTLASSLGLLNIARKAFEQGLQCSPRHWICMEKLIEVLITIGDEATCLAVVERLLKLHPTHPRAQDVKRAIVGRITQIQEKKDGKACFVPVGLDVLEPKLTTLPSFRKRKNENPDSVLSVRKRRAIQTLEISLTTLSWFSLVKSILHVIEEQNNNQTLLNDGSQSEKSHHLQELIPCLANVPLKFLLPRSQSSGNQISCSMSSNFDCSSTEVSRAHDSQNAERKIDEMSSFHTDSQNVGTKDSHPTRADAAQPRPDDRSEMSNEEEPHLHERRSSRLERLRSRRHEKCDEALPVDHSKYIRESLECFIFNDRDEASPPIDAMPECINVSNCSNIDGCLVYKGKCLSSTMKTRYFQSLQDDNSSILSNKEEEDVLSFLQQHASNSGAYHMAELIIQKISGSGTVQCEDVDSLLKLEKLTRGWAKERSVMCSLYLSEIYVDKAGSAVEESELDNYLDECNYHLCKVLEIFALSLNVSDSGQMNSWMANNKTENLLFRMSLDTIVADQVMPDTHNESDVDSNWLFCVRFCWLSGRYSVLSHRQEKGLDEFRNCLSLLKAKQQDQCRFSFFLPHCKIDMEISVDTVNLKLQEAQIVGLLQGPAASMLAKENYLELIELLVPMFFDDGSTKRGRSNSSNLSYERHGLEMLISACRKTQPENVAIALQCHFRKLEIIWETCKTRNSNAVLPGGLGMEHEDQREIVDSSSMMIDEMKVIIRCATLIRERMDDAETKAPTFVQPKRLAKMQRLLLQLLCYSSSTISSKKTAGVSLDQVDIDLFVDTAIIFCRIQHLHPGVSIKQQVALLATIHEILAEHELCCAGITCDNTEAPFLKMAIKHLLALDILLKTSILSSNPVSSPQEIGNAFGIDGCNKSIATLAGHCGDQVSASEVNQSEETVDTSKEVSAEVEKCRDNAAGEVEPIKFYTEEKKRLSVSEDHVDEIEEMRVELGLDNALDQSFFCLYGLNLKGGLDSPNPDGLALHKNTSCGDFQTKEQCAGVLQYVLPYARACSKACLIKLRKVLRAVRKQFPQPPQHVLLKSPVHSFLDSLDFDETSFCSMAMLRPKDETILKCAFGEIQDLNKVPRNENIGTPNATENRVSGEGIVQRESTQYNDQDIIKKLDTGDELYIEVYGNLYYLLSQVEEVTTRDKWAGFVLTEDGEDFVEQNAKLYKYDLIYNPLRFESWFRLASIYDEEVDLMLNDGSKNVNSLEWRKNERYTSRLVNSRRRTRRCLLMSLALANTEAQQCQVHELLALVYYDSIQNVVPSYDQRHHTPRHDAMWISTCQSAFEHFKQAFAHRPDWTHLFYLGKLSEKLGRSVQEALSYYAKALEMNQSVVDPIYRLHRSRMKVLCGSHSHDIDHLRVVAEYCYSPSLKERLGPMFESHEPVGERGSSPKKDEDEYHNKIQEIWKLLFEDSMAALQACVDGELKHFHKARFGIAKGLFRRANDQDIEKAKDELSFCFKSSRSSFTINMWELDGVVKKNRRKPGGGTSGKRILELGLPESSRKFITCVRKYLLFYIDLCQKSGDVITLERAYTSLRGDKKFSICLEDITGVAFGKYIDALGTAITGEGKLCTMPLQCLLEKMFNIFMDHGASWPDPDESSNCGSRETTLYSYIHRYLDVLESECRIDALEQVNERMRKRGKSSRLSSPHFLQICKHALLSWCRTLCSSLSQLTSESSSASLPKSDPSPHLIIDLDYERFLKSSYDDDLASCLFEKGKVDASAKSLMSSGSIMNMKAVPVMQASAEHADRAASLLRSAHVFYRDSSSGPFPDGINVYITSGSLSTGNASEMPNAGFEVLDLSTPRKLLVWAFALVQGRPANVLEVVKFCEEQAKKKYSEGLVK